MSLTLSIILPVYNQEKYVAETIESVLAQTHTNFELLVHDDGSTDGSAQIIRRYAAKDPRVRASFAPNAGRCCTTNALVEQAQSPWCVFLDADDVMLPERLEKQLAYHQLHPEVDATSCHCYYINEVGMTLGIQRRSGLRTIEEGRQTVAKGQYAMAAFTGFMLKKQAFKQSGGLRTQFWPCDDFEFSNRLLEQGFTLIILDEVLMRYRIHSTSVTTIKPLHLYDKTGFVMACLDRKRASMTEPTFDEFMAERKLNPWWVKTNRLRYNYAQIFFRNAAVALMSKNYLSFGCQVAISSVLSPKHIFLKFRNLIN